MEELENIWFGPDEELKVLDTSEFTGENGTLRVVTTTDDKPRSYLKDDMLAEKANGESNNESEAMPDDSNNGVTTENPEEKSFESVEIIESEETDKPEETIESEEKSLPEDPPEGKFTPSELNLRNSLFVWRGQEMSVNAAGDQLVIDDDLIDAIVERKPKTIEELYEIDGLTEAIIERYGQAIVNMTSHTP